MSRLGHVPLPRRQRLLRCEFRTTANRRNGPATFNLLGRPALFLIVPNTLPVFDQVHATAGMTLHCTDGQN
jgi:hypothetical protein